MLKSFIFYILSHLFYHIGNISCKILHLKCFRYADENNKPLQWLADFYMWCMRVSLELDVNEKVWKKPDLCEWKWDGPYNCYHLGCGAESYAFESGEQLGNEDELTNFEFCPWCGREIVEKDLELK